MPPNWLLETENGAASYSLTAILSTCHWFFYLPLRMNQKSRNLQLLNVPHAELSPYLSTTRLNVGGEAVSQCHFLWGREAVLSACDHCPKEQLTSLLPMEAFFLIPFWHGRTHSDFTHKSFLSPGHRHSDSP